MSKYEDDAMDLIETVAENSHHNAAKPFGRGAMPKALDAKSAETGMLLERIDKMAEVQNLLLDRLNIRNGSEGLAPVSLQEASPCATCSRFDHVELDCPVIDVSFSCVVKTQIRWSKKIYKTELTKTRYNNQVLGKYRVDPQRAGLTLIAELTWSNIGLEEVLNKRK